MIITCIGHAEFLIELENGMRLATDPYDESCGYAMQSVAADAVLVSHGHHDHAAVDAVRGWTSVIDTAGTHTLAPDVTVTGIEAFHDDRQGALRGKTLLFLIEAEGLRVAHLGDLGHLPTAEQAEALSPVDILMLPVGGHFTIDAAQAREVASLLRARVVLPMHYRTEATATWPIAPVEDFTALYPAGTAETLPLLRVTKDDLPCQPHIAVLQPTAL